MKRKEKALKATSKQITMFDTVGNQRFGKEWGKKREIVKMICGVNSAKDITKKDMMIILDKLANASTN